MNLSEYENKRIELITTDNEIYRGTVGDYIEAEEDEDGRDMIVLDDEIRNTPIGFYAEDIFKISII